MIWEDGDVSKRKRRERRKVEREIDRKLLSPEEKTYVKLRAAGIPKNDAYAMAFNEEGGEMELVAKASSLERRHDIVAELQRLKEELKKKIVEEAPDAFNRLVELSKFARSEKVRLDANKDILNRAGFQEPVKLQTLAIFSFMTPEQLKEMLRAHMLRSLEMMESGRKEEE